MRHHWNRAFGLTVANLVLGGCACLQPHPCGRRTDPVGDKMRLLNNSFCAVPVSTSERSWTVYTPKGTHKKEGPPVMLLHEMPALSAEVLELGLRLDQAGYSVYIPLLFGKADDNPQDPLLGIRRGIAMRGDRTWLAGKGNVHRPIVDQIDSLCREYILRHHGGQRLGVIGMCFTGVLPMALVGQETELAQLAAPVISQPAIPLPSCSSATKRQTGLSDMELQAAEQHIRDNHLEILGFRFQGDQVSPAERFAALRQSFLIDGRQHFIGRTVPEWDYVRDGKLSPRSHSVLAGCYHKDFAPASGPSSTEVAWQRLLNFLHSKLDGSAPRRYVEPYPDRLLK